MKVAPQDVYDYLISQGVSDAAARGIMANIVPESNFVVDAQQKDGPGIGLFQYSSAGRKRAFLAYMDGHGGLTNWKAQIDFALKEAQDPYYRFDPQANDPVSATLAWMKYFEAPHDQSQTNQNARVANLDLFKNITPSPTSTPKTGPDPSQSQWWPAGDAPGSGEDLQDRYQGMQQFHVGNMYYLVGPIGDSGAYWSSGVRISSLPVQEMSPDDWHNKEVTLSDGGAVSQFVQKQMSWQSVLNFVLGQANLYGTGALDDPGIQSLVSDLISGIVDFTDENEIKRRRNATAWWQAQTQKQYDWPNLSGAEQDAEVMNMAAQLANSYWQYSGKWIDMGKMTDVNALMSQAPDLYKYAYQVASGAMTDLEAIEVWIKPAAAQNPNSWWSEQLRQRSAQGFQSQNDAENYAEQIVNSFGQWGVPMDYSQAKDYGTKIAAGTMSMADVMEVMKDQAQGLYPNKPRETATNTWAAPYVSTYGSLMERPDPGLQSNDIQQALSTGMTIGDFRKYLKAKPEWQYTKNAKDEYASKFMQIGQMMGFE